MPGLPGGSRRRRRGRFQRPADRARGMGSVPLTGTSTATMTPTIARHLGHGTLSGLSVTAPPGHSVGFSQAGHGPLAWSTFARVLRARAEPDTQERRNPRAEHVRPGDHDAERPGEEPDDDEHDHPVPALDGTERGRFRDALRLRPFGGPKRDGDLRHAESVPASTRGYAAIGNFRHLPPVVRSRSTASGSSGVEPGSTASSGRSRGTTTASPRR